jgi:CRP-like cAMP-binding protein
LRISAVYYSARCALHPVRTVSFELRLKLAGLGEDNGYELSMTQEQLGDATGLTPVHVNRMLQALAREGLINRRMLNRSRRLAEAAEVGDFDTTYLHAREGDAALH